MLGGNDTYSASQFLLTIMTQCTAANVQFSPPESDSAESVASEAANAESNRRNPEATECSRTWRYREGFVGMLNLWDSFNVDFANLNHSVEFCNRQHFANIRTGIEHLDG